MVLDKLPIPGRPANLDYCWAWVSVLAVGVGGDVWTFFLLSTISLCFLPLQETAQNRLKYCLKVPLNPKQPASQPNIKSNYGMFSNLSYGIHCHVSSALF